MSMRTLLGSASLASVLLLTACDEEEQTPREQESEQSEDKPSNSGKADGGATEISDAGDAGVQAQDAGSTGDASSSQDSGNTPSSTDTHFFLPTLEPDNTAAPSVEVDSVGNVHTVYPRYAGGHAYYAFCAGDGSCKDSKDAKVVKFETEGTVANAMLALTSDGKPRVLLSAYAKVYWASCDQNCTEQSSWKLSVIHDHAGKKQVTGEALALDPQGRPRFLMHTYRALFGIGQDEPEEHLVSCDASDCSTPSAWRHELIEREIWQNANLRYDAQGRFHASAAVVTFEGRSPKTPVLAYISCTGNCNTVGDFHGVGFGEPYESQTEAVTMNPASSIALTKAGAPRIALIGKSDKGEKQLLYYACDQDCSAGNSWHGILLTQHSAIDSGLDLALDAQDRPRLVYTFNYNILLRYCDAQNCVAEGSMWDDALVEKASSIPADKIFLWDNCTIGAWFLHDPSIALTSTGAPRVGYQIRDVSGGYTRPDPSKPGCTAGLDMTLSRLTIMNAVK